MTIALNHTIVPSRNKNDAAQWFAEIFGLPFDHGENHFAPVRINQTLTFLFSNETTLYRCHYAFHVSDEEFDAVLSRIKQKGVVFGSAPWSLQDGMLNDWKGGRGFHFQSPDGHVLELMTVAQ